MSVLYLMVGLLCSGKSTMAKRLKIEAGVLRLTPDDELVKNERVICA